MVKVKIPLPPNTLYGGEAEWVWADDLGNGLYRVRNVPFFAKGLSYGDLIRAKLEDAVPEFSSIAEHSGHSTYRIYIRNDSGRQALDLLIQDLRALRCDIEGATEKLMAVDVPSEVDVYKVYARLEKAEQEGIIDFQEGHCGHKLRT